MVELQVVSLITVIVIGVLYNTASLPIRRRVPISSISGRSRQYVHRAPADSRIYQDQQRMNYLRYSDRPRFRTSDRYTGRPVRALGNYRTARISDGLGAVPSRRHRQRGGSRLRRYRSHLEPARLDRTENVIRPELSYTEPGYGNLRVPSSETSEMGYIHRSRVNRYGLETPHMTSERHYRDPIPIRRSSLNRNIFDRSSQQNYFPYSSDIQRSAGRRVSYMDPDLLNYDLNSVVDRNTIDYADLADRNTVTEETILPNLDRGTKVRVRNLAKSLGADSISVRRISPRGQPEVNVHSTALSNDALIDYLTEIRPERQRHGAENTRISRPSIRNVRKGLWNDSTALGPPREVSSLGLGVVQPKQEKQIIRVSDQSTISQGKNYWNMTMPFKLPNEHGNPNAGPTRKSKQKMVQNKSSVKDKKVISLSRNTSSNDKRLVAGETLFNNPIRGLKRNVINENKLMRQSEKRSDISNLGKKTGQRNQNTKIIEENQSLNRKGTVTMERTNRNRKNGIALTKEGLKRNSVHIHELARSKGKQAENIYLRQTTIQRSENSKVPKSQSNLKNKEAANLEQNIRVEPYLTPARTGNIPFYKEADAHLIDAISETKEVPTYLQASDVAKTDIRYSGKISSPSLEPTIMTQQAPKSQMPSGSNAKNADIKAGRTIDIIKQVNVNLINAVSAPQSNNAAFISHMPVLNNKRTVNSQQAGNRYVLVMSGTQSLNNKVPVPNAMKMSEIQKGLGDMKMNILLDNNQRTITSAPATKQSYTKQSRLNEKAILTHATVDPTDQTGIKGKVPTTFGILEQSPLTKSEHVATLTSTKYGTVLSTGHLKPSDKYVVSETVGTESLKNVESKQATGTKHGNVKAASWEQTSSNPSVDNRAKQFLKIPTVNGKSTKHTENVRVRGENRENVAIHNIVHGFADNKLLENIRTPNTANIPEKTAVAESFETSANLSPMKQTAIMSEIYSKPVNKNANTKIVKEIELKTEANKHQILDDRTADLIPTSSTSGVNNIAKQNFETSSVTDKFTHHTAVKSLQVKQKRNLELLNRSQSVADNTRPGHNKAPPASAVLQKSVENATFKDSAALTPISNTHSMSDVFPKLVDIPVDTGIVGAAKLKPAENKQTAENNLDSVYFMQTSFNSGANIEAGHNLEIPPETGTSIKPSKTKFFKKKQGMNVVKDILIQSFTGNTLLENIKESVAYDELFKPIFTNFNETSAATTPTRHRTIMSDVFPKQNGVSADTGIVDPQTLVAIKATQASANENLDVKATELKQTSSKLAVNNEARKNLVASAVFGKSTNNTKPKSLQKKQTRIGKIEDANHPFTDSIHLDKIKSSSASDALEKSAVTAFNETSINLAPTGHTDITSDKYQMPVDINADIGIVGAANLKAVQNKLATATKYSGSKVADYPQTQSDSRVVVEASKTLETPAVSEKSSKQTEAKILKENDGTKAKMDTGNVSFADNKLPVNIKASSDTDTLQKLAETALTENVATLTQTSHTNIISDAYPKSFDMNAGTETVGSAKPQTLENKQVTVTKMSAVKNPDSIKAKFNPDVNIVAKQNLELQKVIDKSTKHIEGKSLKEMRGRNVQIHSQSQNFADKTNSETIKTASASDILKKPKVISSAFIENPAILPPKSDVKETVADNLQKDIIKASSVFDTFPKTFDKNPDNRPVFKVFSDITQPENVPTSDTQAVISSHILEKPQVSAFTENSATLTSTSDKVIMSEKYPKAVDIYTDTGIIRTTKLLPVENKTVLITKNHDTKNADLLQALSAPTVAIKDKQRLETVVVGDINTKHSGTKTSKKTQGQTLETQNAIQSFKDSSVTENVPVQKNGVAENRILPNRKEKSSVTVTMEDKGLKTSLSTTKQLIDSMGRKIKTNLDKTNIIENGENRMSLSSTNKTQDKNLKVLHEHVDLSKIQSTPKRKSKHLNHFGSDNIEKHMQSVFLEIAKQASKQRDARKSTENKHYENHSNSAIGDNITSTSIKSSSQNIDKIVSREKTIKSEKATDSRIGTKYISPTGERGVTSAPSDGFATTAAKPVTSSSLSHVADVSTGSTQSAEGARAETEAAPGLDYEAMQAAAESQLSLWNSVWENLDLFSFK